MKPIPDNATIAICGHEYQFIRHDELVNEDGAPIHGLYQPQAQKMHVMNGHTELYDCHVSLHEIMHAILEHCGLGETLTAEQNEAVCNAVSYGMLSVRVNGKPILK